MPQIVETTRAPKAIGPYSQAVRAGEFLFLCGQIPLDPATGEIVGSNAAEQTVRVMDNIEAVLAAAGMTMDSVVKTTIFLVNLQDFGAVNEAYGKRFSSTYPARSTVEVRGLPRGALVEI